MKVFYTDRDGQLREELFRRIKSDLARVPSDLERVLLVVPAQSTLSAEEDALSHIGGKGTFTLNVISGEKLRQDILRETGGSGRTPINTIGRGMMLRRAVKLHESEFRAFSGVCRDSRFIDMAGDFLVQMKQNELSAEDLGRLADGMEQGSLLERKLRDMKMIAEAYEDALAGTFTDSEDALAFVTGKAAESEYVRTSKIYYYGFYSFTKREIEFLRALDARSAGLSVALISGDAPEFAATRSTIAALGAAAEKIEDVCGGAVFPARKVEIVNCASPYTQAETIAARILRLRMEEGLGLQDFCVLVPDAPGQGKLVRRVLETLQIPVFMDETRPIVHSSSAEAVSALLELAGGEYKARDVIKFLKSGVTGEDAEAVWRFENYVKQYHIKGKRFLAPFKYKDNDTEPYLAELEELRARLSGLLEPFVGDFSGAKTVAEKCAVLMDFLAGPLDLEARLEAMAARQAEEGFADAAEETRQIWGLLQDLTAQMTELIGSDAADTAEFRDILLGALADVKVGVLPQAEGRVLIGSIARTQIRDRKVVFAVGFCDGLVPGSSDASGILTDREISVLAGRGTVLSKPSERLAQEEVFSIYKSLACADRLLWIGVPASNENGDALKPSLLLADIRNRVQRLTESRDIENSEDPLDFMVGGLLPMEKTASVMRAGLGGEDVPEVWKAAYNVLSAKAPQLRAGLEYVRQDEKLSKKAAKELYRRANGDIVLSPSRLDRFAGCPFKHFIDYGLRPLIPREFGIAGAEIGDIHHEALLILSERLSAPARAAGIAMTDPASPWMTVTSEELDAMLKEILDGMAEGSLGGVMQSAKPELYRTERVLRVCRVFAKHMIAQVRAGRIDDMHFEAEFGRGGVFPTIVLNTAAGKVYVEGKIDRVDEMPGHGASKYVKVVDYKSGGDKFDKELIDRGLKLQLMTYLEAALGGTENEAAGVYYFRIPEDVNEGVISDVAAEGISEELAAKIAKAYRMDGVSVSDDLALNDLDRQQPSQADSIVTNVKLKKDNSLMGRFITSEDMAEFREQFRQTLKDTAERLCLGDVSADPKKVADKYDACKYCEYGAACLKAVNYR